MLSGSTPIGVYRELVRLHSEKGLSFRHVVTFNLDEYWPMPPDSIHSYHRFMRENLFDHVDVEAANIHIPDGTVARDDVDAACAAYEAAILAAREIAILATGEHKSAIVRRAVEGDVNVEVAATFLQRHLNTTCYV